MARLKLMDAASSLDDESEQAPQAVEHIEGVVLGKVRATTSSGRALVSFLDRKQLVAATSIPPLTEADLGCEVALLFEGGDPNKPMIVGRLHPATSRRVAETRRQNLELTVDGRRLQVQAEDELVLACGKATITLRRNGRVVIRGSYVETRSTGVNRIRGGSVRLN